MKRLIIKCISLTAIIGLISLSSEGWAASKEDARSMAKRVEAYIKTNGKAKAILEVQKDNGIFEKGEIYIYIFDFNATIIAHPKLPTWVGKSFLNRNCRTETGFY